MPLFNTGDHIRTVEPVGLDQVGLRVVRGVVRMGVIEADNVLPPAAGQLEGGNDLFGADSVTALGIVSAGVVTGQRQVDGASIHAHDAQKNAAAFARVAAFRLPAQ